MPAGRRRQSPEHPALKFAELHVNEKLSRMHRPAPDNPGVVPPLPGFDLTAPPFRSTSSTSNDLVKIDRLGDSVLIKPVPNPLVRTASQKVAGKSELARFKVPRQVGDGIASGRRSTACRGPPAVPRPNTPTSGSNSPDRRRLLAEARPQRNPRPAAGGTKSFDRTLMDGGYEAAHLVDRTCDAWSPSRRWLFCHCGFCRPIRW
jgi:hypothetical protein